ncbi:MAG: hypothetical protein ABI867_11920 [Kofleriaceae bacterium]
MLLQPQIAFSVGPVARLFALAIGFTVASAVVAIAVSRAPEDQTLVELAVPAELPVPVSVTANVVSASPVAAATTSDQLVFVFRAGGATYVRLADLDDDTLPKHGKLTLHDDNEAGISSVASVATADVPAAYRDYLGKHLVVDSACKTTVVGFAVVSRLIGDPGYAGVEAKDWNAALVLKSGAKVLAARVDNVSCKGVYARDAALSPVVTLKAIDDDQLADAARSALLASDVAAETQRAWIAERGEGQWSDHATPGVRVLRHPTTGVTWVIVHANYSEGCGGPTANVYGLFRANRDGSLETVSVRALEDLHSIETVLDVDGDGQLELLGRPWLGLDLVRANAEGAAVDRLTLPLFGCPC